MPIAHNEGNYFAGPDELNQLEGDGQIAFRYTDSDTFGPANPNGAARDIAGVISSNGRVLGMMPHPERVFHGWQHTDWTSSGKKPDGPGDGRALFEGVVEFLCK